MRNRVKEFRESLEMKQEEVASKAGVGRNTVSDIEASKHIPGVDIAMKLVHVLERERTEDVFILEGSDWVQPQRRSKREAGK